MDESNDLAVSLAGVSYSYVGAEKRALNDISLSIPKGQCVLITGPSGCGKTTLTRLINGLVPHVYPGDVSGKVHVLGSDVSTWSSDELGVRVGSVFQNPRSQFVNLDVASEIAFGCENLGIEQAEMASRVKEAASALEIENLMGRSIEELSGGQKQAVILASAFAMHPDVFVLDEPTASLDVESMKRLSRVVAALKDEGKTVIVSEHRLWWLSGIADRIICMKDGRIEGDWGSTEYGSLSRNMRLDAGMRAWDVSEMELEVGKTADSKADAPQNADAVLRAQGLDVSFRRGAKVLDGLDIDLKRGDILGIIGKNGAGKTTLLRTLSGLKREKQGRISVQNGETRFRKRPKFVHLVMQEPGYQLFSDSVEAEIRATVGDASSILSAFGLDHLADRHPLSLSGGERQRLAIAAGIARGAEVLVLDEPTSGLDYANMELIASALRKAALDGAAIAVVTHDYEFLCAACTSIAEIEDGRVRATYPLNAINAKSVREKFGF